MTCRAILISLNSVTITIILLRTSLSLTPYILSIILILQIVEIGYKNIKKENKTLLFLESLINNEDTIINRKGRYYNNIKNVFSDIISKHKESNKLAERNSELLDVILLQIDIGIIVYCKDREVFLINKAARKILSLNFLNYVSDEILSMINGSATIYSNSCNFILHEKMLTILTFQNIKDALDNKELDTWNELFNTLNHEIMNSITPISSLANSALNFVDESSNRDLVEALEVIESRSSNLLKFVEKYRLISKIPTPKRELITVSSFLNKIALLLSSYLKENDVLLSIAHGNDYLQIYADLILLENLLINLIKNSIEAESKNITVSYSFEDDKTIISIIDDGIGLSNETEAKAFLPFYTTKQTGSGLGLSLSRQIMFVHNGSISISKLEKGTKVTLLFP